MSWLPRFYPHEWCSCGTDDVTYEGWSVEIVWGRFVLELCFGKEDRAFARATSATTNPPATPTGHAGASAGEERRG